MRKKRYRKRGKTVRVMTVAAAGFLLLQLGGCKGSPQSADGTVTETAEAGAQGMKEPKGDKKPGSGEVSAEEPEGNGKTVEYKDSDLDASWSEADSVVITCSGSGAEVKGDGALAENGVIRISKEGTYVLRGEYTGQIAVDAGKEDKVRLVLDGFTVTCENSSPIYGIQSDKIILILADGSENLVRDGSEYVFDSPEEDEPDAAVFSKDDLTVNGSGALTVEGNYQNGIRSKNDLKIISGTVTVTAVKDAIKGKDSVVVKDGTITVESGEDGIKSNGDTDEEKGYVVLDGGTITIAAGDDAIHAETWLTINDGTIEITESYEGLEGRRIDINGGYIKVKSSDDGINAAWGSTEDENQEQSKKQADPDTYVRITDGNITVDASADGIDSNGNLYVKGGTVVISGPENSGDGALDYNGTAVISGGSFVAAGSSGMMQTFSESSGQNMIMVYYSEQQAAGTGLVLTAEDGTELLSLQPAKAYECVLISLPELSEGDTYRLVTGSESQEITVDQTVTQVGERTGGHGSPGGGRMGGGQGKDERPEGKGRPEQNR